MFSALRSQYQDNTDSYTCQEPRFQGAPTVDAEYPAVIYLVTAVAAEKDGEQCWGDYLKDYEEGYEGDYEEYYEEGEGYYLEVESDDEENTIWRQ
jgi:hypothetical protein